MIAHDRIGIISTGRIRNRIPAIATKGNAAGQTGAGTLDQIAAYNGIIPRSAIQGINPVARSNAGAGRTGDITTAHNQVISSATLDGGAPGSAVNDIITAAADDGFKTAHQGNGQARGADRPSAEINGNGRAKGAEVQRIIALGGERKAACQTGVKGKGVRSAAARDCAAEGG